MYIPPFKPKLFVRNKHVQTILSSKAKLFMKNKNNIMIDAAKLVQLQLTLPDTNETVVLNGYHSALENPKGLIILLHGWLGDAHSTYMVERGQQLYQQGFAIFRLNLRDHGNTTHLNSGVFHGCRLAEVFQAVAAICENNAHLPVTIIGFSMGGSFALRVAWKNHFAPIKNLKKVIAICPSVDPKKVTMAIDQHKIYLHYFSKKWRKVLAEKQQHFPDLYNFQPMLGLKSCMAMTDVLITKYSDFNTIDDYFTEYEFCKTKLQQANIPMTILAAADDPVIPIESFAKLQNINPLLDIHITELGGHVGYIDVLPWQCWLDKVLPAICEG